MANTNLTDLKHEQAQNFKYNDWKTVSKNITFIGGTPNAIGDFDGTGDPFSIFTITGTVKIKFYAICTTTLVGASATIETGIAGNTAGLIAQTTATNIAINEIWHDASPDSSIELDDVAPEEIIGNGLDIIGTVGTANITAGAILFVCVWKALSSDGLVESS